MQDFYLLIIFQSILGGLYPRFWCLCSVLLCSSSLRPPVTHSIRAVREWTNRAWEVRDGTLRERPTAREASRERCESGVSVTEGPKHSEGSEVKGGDKDTDRTEREAEVTSGGRYGPCHIPSLYYYLYIILLHYIIITLQR